MYVCLHSKSITQSKWKIKKKLGEYGILYIFKEGVYICTMYWDNTFNTTTENYDGIIWSQILSSNSAFNLIVNFDYILNNLIWNGFKMASQVVFATADVSRSTFCHDDTHKDWQSEYNTSVAVVAGNKYKCNKSVYEQLVCHWLPIHKTYLYRYSEHLTFNLICIKWLNFPALFVRKQC